MNQRTHDDAPDIDGGEKALDAALDAYYPSKGWRNSNQAHYRAEMNRAITAYQAAADIDGGEKALAADILAVMLEPIACDVMVAPATILRKGVSFATLRAAIEQRRGRDAVFAHPTPSAGNDGGMDAVEVAYDCLRFRKEDPHKLSEHATVERIVRALAQSAADERERCEMIAERYRRDIQVDDYSGTALETAEAIRDAIAARGETKGEGR